MSDGDRSDRPKFEIKIPLILGAILSVVLIGAGLIQHGNYHDTASRNAADYARQANDHIRESCLPLAPQAERQCAEIANNTARQNQREEYDLYSQKAMSLWTAVMGGVGVVGVILTGVGVYLIWQTWLESQAMAAAALQTNRSYIENERGYIRIFRTKFSFDKGLTQPSGFRVHYENYGKSNAIVTKIEWQALPSPKWPEKFGHELLDNISAAPGEEDRTEHLGLDEFPETPFYFVVVFHYKTLTESGLLTHACYKVNYTAQGILGSAGGYYTNRHTCPGMPNDT